METASYQYPIHELLIQGVVDYAIYMLTPEGRVASWNAGAERITGYTADEIIGENFSRFYSEEDRAAGLPQQALNSALTQGRFAVEAWRYRKDGSRFWATVVIDPIYKDGVLVGFAKITRDMTEQRQAALAAIESERRFRLFVRGVTDYALYMLDPHGHVTNWNLGAERIKGYAAGEIVGHHFSRFYMPEDVASGVPRNALETACREGRYEAEGWRRRKDGTRFWAGVVIDAIYDEGELIGFAKITRDLTERRKSEEELERSREELAQAQKMEAVGQLTGGLAHDFNNMLTAVIGNLDVIRARMRQGRYGGLDRYLAAAESSANRAASLTHRLLAFARRQTLDPKPTEPNKLVSDMMQLIDRAVGPHIEERTKLASDLWMIKCDPSQLENALLNICLNARDAMPHNGLLTIETSNIAVNGRAALDQDLAPGDYVSISVSDTGSGMPADVVARAFEPFYTTKPLGSGTGLGLSMVYGFARQSGGHVTISSTVGEGTTVRVVLPRYFGDAPEDAAKDEPLASQHHEAGRTVVLVDDEPLVRQLLTEALKDEGYEVLEASNAASGLKILNSNAQIALLITDVGLPGAMNGRQMADAARERRPNLKVLFVTGYAESSVATDGHLGPGMYVLGKPFSVKTLSSKIQAIFSAPGA